MTNGRGLFLMAAIAAECVAPVAPGRAVTAVSIDAERPDLGPAAPRIAVVFPAHDARAGVPTGIYVWANGGWLLAFQGAYTRGSLLSGRGGIGNRYRLIDDRERITDLVFKDGQLRLIRDGIVIARHDGGRRNRRP